ncbi:AraC family transcriptional regulator [Clostridium cellulovorans]|uniref:Transcriptional regulator, AraC family n=1 Tax=Clostridium cellulovorans (strain ATCC 35296 / DSM 3052 / OCM 3 / 743B) TaxID=573061 RepID=D9SS36_CLOC7|nr:AraC family transcriptional regulator [Clostridium cellulovorans]ADL52483.1 transcriptional regulator, AraC family [Clostridium cellulovorans 743B]
MITNSLYNPKLLNKDYRPIINTYYFRQWINYKMDYHTHDRVEIMYVIDGQCEIDVATDNVNNLKLKKGDFILLDAGTVHRLIVLGEKSCRMLNIEFSFIEDSDILTSIRLLIEKVKSIALLFEMRCPFLLLKDNNDIYHSLKNIVIQLGMESEENQFSIQLLFYELLLKISKVAMSNENTSTSNIYINKAKHFISMNYDKDITIKDISSYVNINEDYLNRIFKKHTGHTITEYVTLFRIEKAKMLLSNTDIPIIDICSYVGINSRQYFSQVFKKCTGISPYKYRKSIYISSWS